MPIDTTDQGQGAPKKHPTEGERIRAKRSRGLFEAGLSAFFSKGIVLIVNAISIPITVRYLGAEQFGLWVTISTTLSVLVVLDLGMANAMTNFISKAYALDDKSLAGRYAGTGFWAIVAISALLGLLGFAIWPFVPWGSLFPITGDVNGKLVRQAVAIAYVVFLVGLPSNLASKILGGYQELRTSNIFATVGSVASLLAVVVVAVVHGGLLILVAVSSGATVVTNLVCLVWLWTIHKPWLAPTKRNIDRRLLGELMRSSNEYFILQIAGLLVFNSDNFIIAHYLGTAEVTPYSVTWKLVGYAAVLQSILTPALWPAYAEAYVRGDMRWIRRTLRKVMLATMGVALAAALVLVFWGRVFIRIWAGSQATPSQLLMSLMCAWILMSTFMANTATVLAATNEIKLQSRLAMGVAVVNLIVSIWLVQRIGSVGVITGTIVSYVFVLVVPQTWKVLQVLRRPHQAIQADT